MRLAAIMEWGLSALTIYAIPMAMGMISLSALLFWDDLYSSSPAQHLELRALVQTGSTLSTAEATRQLGLVPAKRYFEPRLTEGTLWFKFSTPIAPETAKYVEFPSRHATSMACWEVPLLGSSADSNNIFVNAALSQAKTGYALKLDRPGLDVVCRMAFVGPARITADLWSSAQFDTSENRFHRITGLMDGGLLVLALFVLITALINRQPLYLIYAAWLIVTLRSAAISSGWDAQWLGYAVPANWLVESRSITRAVYALLTLSLFRSLFRDVLKNTRFGEAIKIAHWLCVPLLVAAFALPRNLFIPAMWFIAGPGLILIIASLGNIVIKTRSRVALWYGASLATILLSSLSEIVAAASVVQGTIGIFNSVTAALGAALMASLAIAEQMRQEHLKRLEVQAELAHTYEAMPIGLFTLDLHGHFTSANPALLRMLGPDVLTDGGNNWQQYFIEGAWTKLHQLVHDKDEVELEIRAKPVPGVIFSRRFLVKATLARDKIEGSLQDVTEKSRAADDLSFLAMHDPLTKVLNRRGIEQVLNSAIMQIADGMPVALAYLDLDRFKLINDLFGHGAGDDVLQQVCKRVSDLLSHGLQFGRVGGDEFVIVFPETPIALASLMCRGIIDSIGKLPYRVGEKAFYVRGSIGLVELSTGMQFNDAISTADRACHQAKTSNSGGLVVYERHALAFRQHEAELKLIALLSSSSATDGLYLEMQPIMSLSRPHESLNFEVLLRMRDADGNVVPTNLLISAAESSGRMGMIDRWVLTTTLAWLNKNYSKLKHTKFVCINLSGDSLNDEKFLGEVFAMLEENMHLVTHLCLEITESVALRDLKNTRRFVDQVRSYGAKVALDDFGAGYTSFSYLKEFTTDLLKIDGSFIVNMNQHPANIAIVEAIVSLAKNLGMKVIAEWAEDNATVQTLTEIGVDYVQGFAVARSQHPDKVLTAESSASFIQNEALAKYVLMIEKAGRMQTEVDLFSDVHNFNLH